MLKLSSGNTRTLKRFLAVILTISLLLGTFTTTTLATSENGGEENDGSGYVEAFDGSTDNGDDPANSGDDTTDNGDNPADNGDDPTDNGDASADNGDNTADNGDDTADNGDDTADNGDDTADNGEENQPPAQDEQQTAYTVTNSVANASLSPLQTTQGEVYTGVITPNDGYLLPADVTVKIGEGAAVKVEAYDPDNDTQSIPDGFTYTRDYDNNTAEITIGAEFVIGNITISGTALEPIGIKPTATITTPMTFNGTDFGGATSGENWYVSGGTLYLTDGFTMDGAFAGVNAITVSGSSPKIVTNGNVSINASSTFANSALLYSDTGAATIEVQSGKFELINAGPYGIFSTSLSSLTVTVNSGARMEVKSGNNSVLNIAAVNFTKSGAGTLYATCNNNAVLGANSVTLSSGGGAVILESTSSASNVFAYVCPTAVSGGATVKGGANSSASNTLTYDGAKYTYVYSGTEAKYIVIGTVEVITTRNVAITLGQNMTRDESGGALSQPNVSGAITAIKLVAASGYEMPATWTIGSNLTYTRDAGDPTKATISGTPNDDVTATVPDATAVTPAGVIYVHRDKATLAGQTPDGTFAKPYTTIKAAYASIPAGRGINIPNPLGPPTDVEIRVLSNIDEPQQIYMKGSTDDKSVNMTIRSYKANGIEPEETNPWTIKATGSYYNSETNNYNMGIFAISGFQNLTYDNPMSLTLKDIIVDANNVTRIAHIGFHGGVGNADYAKSYLTIEDNVILKNGNPTGAPVNIAGGVYVANGRFTMNGGTIQECKKGGVVVEPVGSAIPKFFMNGGTIEDCEGYGVNLTSATAYGAFYVGGGSKITITNNKDNSGNVGNVFIGNNGSGMLEYITMTSELTAESKIGVWGNLFSQPKRLAVAPLAGYNDWTTGSPVAVPGYNVKSSDMDFFQSDMPGVAGLSYDTYIPAPGGNAIYFDTSVQPAAQPIYVHATKATGTPDGSFAQPYPTIAAAYASIPQRGAGKPTTEAEIRVLSNTSEPNQIGMVADTASNGRSVTLTIRSYDEATGQNPITAPANRWTIQATGNMLDYETGGNNGNTGLFYISGYSSGSVNNPMSLILKDIIVDANGKTRIAQLGRNLSTYQNSFLTIDDSVTLRKGDPGYYLLSSVETYKTAGAVLVQAGTFNMNGGLIENCTAKGLAGGVHVESYGIFNMTGGTIENNEGIGVYVESNFVNFGASDGSDSVITIYNNKDSSGNQRNVHLVSNRSANLIGQPEPTSKIGVHRQDMPTSSSKTKTAFVGTSTYTVQDGDESFFPSDIPAWPVVFINSGTYKAVGFNYDNPAPFDAKYLKAGINTTNGSGYITVNPAHGSKKYAVFTSSGTLVESKNGTGGEIKFENLMPGQEYTVVEYTTGTPTAATTPNGKITIPSVNTAVGGNVSANLGDGTSGKTSITIKPSSNLVKYAVTDSLGNVITTAGGTDGWQTGGGAITFTGLSPETEYRIVTVPIGGTTSGSGYGTAGTPVKTPKGFTVARTGMGDGATDDTITLTDTIATQEYAIVDKNGNIVADWKSNTTDPVAFNDLDATKQYWVITRIKPDGLLTAPVLVPMRTRAVYVKAASLGGDDVDGDGTFLNPYATIQKAYDTLGYSLTHMLADSVPYEIRVLSNLNVTAPTYLSIYAPDEILQIIPGGGIVGRNALKNVTIRSYDATNGTTPLTGTPWTIAATGTFGSSQSTSIFLIRGNMGYFRSAQVYITLQDITLDAGGTTRAVYADSNVVDGNNNPNMGQQAHLILESGATLQNGNPGTYKFLTAIVPNYGGGVFLRNASLTMNGGTISGNVTEAQGGGVMASMYSGIYMTGGTITNNTAKTGGGGVFFGGAYTSWFTVGSGSKIDITGNNDNKSNVLIDSNGSSNHSWITMAGTLAADSKIGVWAPYVDNTYYPNPRVAVLPGGGYKTTNADMAFFTSDFPEQSGLTWVDDNGYIAGSHLPLMNGIWFDISKKSPFGNANLKSGITTTSGNGWVTANPTDSTKYYAVVGPDGKVAAVLQGNDGELKFDGLMPGQKYEVYQVDPPVSPAQPPAVGDDTSALGSTKGTVSIPAIDTSVGGNVTASADGTKTTITINPASDKVQYALIDPTTGNLITTWQPATGGEVVFANLDPGVKYEIVTYPVDSSKADPAVVPGTSVGDQTTGLKGKGATVTTPAANLDEIEPGDIKCGSGTMTGTNKITIDPATPGQEYGLYDPETDTIVWKPESGGKVVFDNLESGKAYEIVTRTPAGAGKDASLHTSPLTITIPALVPEEYLRGSVNDSNIASITINPTESNLDYALLDASGNVVLADWKNSPTGGAITFDGLDPTTEYKIVTRPTGTAPTDPKESIGGTAVVTPPKAVKPVTRETVTPATNPATDKITFPTEAGKEYAVVEKGSTTPVSGTGTGSGDWAEGSGTTANPGSRTVTGLDPNKEYEVLVRDKAATPDDGKIYIPSSTFVPKLIPADNITGSVNDAGKASITINPTDSTLDYALLDKDGNPVTDAGWKNSTTGGAITFDGLDPAKEYKIVTRPKGTSPANPKDAAGGTAVVAPPLAVTPVTRAAEASGTTDSLTFPTVTGREYAVVEKGSTTPIPGGAWAEGTAPAPGNRTVTGLDPNKEYEVLVRVKVPTPDDGKIHLTNSTFVPKLIPADDITGSVNDAGKASITINPTDSNLDYALLDKNGNPVTGAGWKNSTTGGAITFDGLDPAKEYKIVTRPKGTSPANPKDVGGGTSVVAPPLAVTPVTRAEEASGTTDKIIFPTETGKEYAVVVKGSTTPIVGGAWQEGTGTSSPTDGIRTVTGLDPNKEYEVLVRVKDAGDGKIYLTNSTEVPKLPGDFDAAAKWNFANNTQVTISPTDPNYKYALLDKDGNLVVSAGGWKTSPNANGTIAFTGLPEGTAYTVVYFPKNQPSPTGTALSSMTGKKIVTPIKPVDANSIKTTTTTLTINPTEPNQSYALIDPDTGDIVTVSSGTAAGWLDGKADNGAITFDNLTPGKVYEVITVPKTLPAGFTKDDVLARPGTNAVTKFNSVTGTLESNGTATVTVDPTQTDAKYAIVDKNGNIVGGASGWKNGTGGALDFTGLTPGEVYKVISVPKKSPDSGYPTSGQQDTAGTAVITPKNPAPAIDATSTTNTVTVKNATGATATDPTMLYALIDASGNVVGEGWKNSPIGGVITFTGLASGTGYTVVARPLTVSGPNDTYANAERPYAQPGFPIATKFGNIAGSYTSDANTSVTVSPTDNGMKYAVVDENGNVVGGASGWKKGTGDALIFSGLAAGGNYKIISVPVADSPASSGFQNKAGVKVISPVKPADSTKVTADQTSITVKDTDPAIEYAIYDPVSGTIVAGGWKTGNNGDLVFSPVAAGKDYQVVTRKKLTEDEIKAGVTSVYAVPGTPITTEAATMTYTVTFNMNGSGETVPTQTPMAVNATFKLPTEPSRAGYVFTGWSDGKAVYPAESIYTMPARNVTFKALWQEAYSISGTVRDANGNPVEGMTVELWRGGEMLSDVTAADGTYSFDNVISGMYNIVAKGVKGIVKNPAYEDIIVTTLVEITNANKSGIDITLPAGKTNSLIQVVGDTPPIMVGNLEKQFTDPNKLFYKDEDIAIIGGQGAVAIEFVAEQKDEEDVFPDDIDSIGAELASFNARLRPTEEGLTVGMYLDFSLWKKVTEYDQARQALSDDTTVSNVPVTPSLLEILIPLPTELQGMAEYRIVRMHDGTPEIINTTPNRNGEYIRLEKEEDGQVVAITLFAKCFSTYALAYSETAFSNPPRNTGGGSSGSSGGGGGGSAAVSTHWIEVPESKTLVKDAQAKDLDYARSSRSGITGIRKNSLLEIGKAGLSYRHDTTQNGAVQVRVYIDEPGKATKDIMVSGHVSGTAVDTVKAKFAKSFPDKKLAVVSLDQQGDFGMTVRVAAKVNLSGMDANNLYFYAYDKKTNKYVNFRPEYRIDANGYLHFATDRAGDIIISDGPLKDTDGGAIPQNPDMGSDGLDNPGTGGDGPGYLVQNAVQTQAPAQLIETQEVVDALPDAEQMAQAEPDDSMGQVKLQIPSTPVEMPYLSSAEGDAPRSMTLTIAIAAILLAAGLSLWTVVAKRRRKR